MHKIRLNTVFILFRASWIFCLHPKTHCEASLIFDFSHWAFVYLFILFAANTFCLLCKGPQCWGEKYLISYANIHSHILYDPKQQRTFGPNMVHICSFLWPSMTVLTQCECGYLNWPSYPPHMAQIWMFFGFLGHASQDLPSPMSAVSLWYLDHIWTIQHLPNISRNWSRSAQCSPDEAQMYPLSGVCVCVLYRYMFITILSFKISQKKWQKFI